AKRYHAHHTAAIVPTATGKLESDHAVEDCRLWARLNSTSGQHHVLQQAGTDQKNGRSSVTVKCYLKVERRTVDVAHHHILDLVGGQNRVKVFVLRLVPLETGQVTAGFDVQKR